MADESPAAEPSPEAPPPEAPAAGPPDMPPSTRAKAGRAFAFALVSVAAAAFLFSVYVVLVYNGNVDQGAGWVTDLELNTWIVLFAVVLAAVLIALLADYVTIGRARAVEPLVEPEATGAPLTEYVVRCANCQGEYAVKDEGVRPLAVTCPHCDHTVEVEGAMRDVLEVLSAEQRMKLLCTHCTSVFDVPYSTERPLYADCPGCGRKGVLKEPATEAAVMEEVTGLPTEYPHSGDPVIDIEGIGEEYAKRLEALGITHTDDLLAADPATMAQMVGAPEVTVQKWRAMADLMRVSGIGKQYAEVLARVGVLGVHDLVQRDARHLADAIQQDLASVDVTIEGQGVRAKRVQGWIKAGKKWVRAHEGAPRRRRAKATA